MTFRSDVEGQPFPLIGRAALPPKLVHSGHRFEEQKHRLFAGTLIEGILLRAPAVPLHADEYVDEQLEVALCFASHWACRTKAETVPSIRSQHVLVRQLQPEFRQSPGDRCFGLQERVSGILTPNLRPDHRSDPIAVRDFVLPVVHVEHTVQTLEANGLVLVPTLVGAFDVEQAAQGITECPEVSGVHTIHNEMLDFRAWASEYVAWLLVCRSTSLNVSGMTDLGSSVWCRLIEVVEMHKPWCR